MIIHLFPGQGAQHKGMGTELFNDFRTLTRTASSILDYDLSELCEHDPDSKLSRTQYTQPALFAVCAMAWIKHFEEFNIEPDMLAGHSLGEITALHIAGVFDFSTALQLVKLRGELMAQAKGGAMLAVIGKDLHKIPDIMADYPEVYVANENADNQMVVSGESESIVGLHAALESQGWQVVRLAVGGAFHSGLMSPAAKAFRTALDDVTLNSPKIPVISNLSAQPYPDEAEQIKDLLAGQINSTVRWADSIRYLRATSANDVSNDYMEFGPNRILTNMMGKIA